MDPVVGEVKSVTYKTIKYLAPAGICVFADVPYLVKTTRNCLYQSGYGKYARYMRNNQKVIVWYVIAQILNDDIENVLKVNKKFLQERIEPIELSTILKTSEKVY